MAGLECARYLYLHSASWEMTECPSSATRQSINHSAEQDGEPGLCAPHRLSWQLPVIFLVQIKVPAAESANQKVTQRTLNRTVCTQWPPWTWQVVAPSWDTSACCFPPTTSDRSYVSSAWDRESHFPWGKRSRHLIFACLTLPCKGRAQGWLPPNFAVGVFH